MDLEENHIVHEFSRLHVLNRSSSTTATANKMDALVHDLNTALELDEATPTSGLHNNAASNSGGSKGTASRRRVWRRRCKSTSNLSSLVQPSTSGAVASTEKVTAPSAVSHNNSDDSSSSAHDVRVVLSSRGERGTSSLQLSDSDEANFLHHTFSSSNRRGKAKVEPQQLSLWSMDMAAPSSHQNASCSAVEKNKGVESDSVNENFSPVRPSTKRKRKFKRMALDPETGGPSSSAAALVAANTNTTSTTSSSKCNNTGTIKRKKVRSRSACDAAAAAAAASAKAKANSGTRQRQLSSSVVPGKRKRSTREKSVEPDHVMVSAPATTHMHAVINEEVNADTMDQDDDEDDDDENRRSSSSLSSSEWEDQDGLLENGQYTVDDDGEADDEQSDWPGHEAAACSFVLTDDDEADCEAASNLSTMPLFAAPSASASASASSNQEMESFQTLTSTARQAYLARMKRLAECVPGREIRAGSRRLRNPQSGFTIKSSSSEQLSRFLQDPSRTELRLTVLRPADRSKIAQMATLYSLQLRYEGPNILVLAKTGKTVRVDYFIVPKTPAEHQPVEVKRRRRTPPPPSSAEEASSASNVNMEMGHQQAVVLDDEEEDEDDDDDKEEARTDSPASPAGGASSLLCDQVRSHSN